MEYLMNEFSSYESDKLIENFSDQEFNEKITEYGKLFTENVDIENYIPKNPSGTFVVDNQSEQSKALNYALKNFPNTKNFGKTRKKIANDRSKSKDSNSKMMNSIGLAVLTQLKENNEIFTALVDYVQNNFKIGGTSSKDRLVILFTINYVEFANTIARASPKVYDGFDVISEAQNVYDKLKKEIESSSSEETATKQKMMEKKLKQMEVGIKWLESSPDINFTIYATKSPYDEDTSEGVYLPAHISIDADLPFFGFPIWVKFLEESTGDEVLKYLTLGVRTGMTDSLGSYKDDELSKKIAGKGTLIKLKEKSSSNPDTIYEKAYAGSLSYISIIAFLVIIIIAGALFR